MASCIESIGGVARIMYGRCDAFAHAWTEVYVGSKYNFELFNDKFESLTRIPIEISLTVWMIMAIIGCLLIGTLVFSLVTPTLSYLNVDYHSDQQIH